MRQAEFNEARLVTVYDAACQWSRDDDFFLSVVNETPRARVLDLGCGTGRLAVAMSAAGHVVTGVDPARASLAAARRKPGAETVTWVEGTSSAIPSSEFDVAVMTSHVAQFLVGDDEWAATLADLTRGLVDGGRLTFDTRDPNARGWERWNPADSHKVLTLPDGSLVENWTEVTAVEDGTVSFTGHNLFADGQDLLSTATLRFRSEAEVRDSLEHAGFTIEHLYGGWQREPVGTSSDGELIVVARA